MPIYFAIAVSSAFSCVFALAEKILYERLKLLATCLGWVVYSIVGIVPALFIYEEIIFEVYCFIVCAGFLVQQILIGSKQPEYIFPTIEEKKLLYTVLLLMLAYFAAE